ncbi:MAG: (2Fe-2S) ferredoxin domain-containing protein [Turicibacter sp.]|uniref:(2Fe-2S) ferredoxin domain-containing protein n=1 Tax=Turicibacter sp. TA25 TaxID=2951142 RepID=UPI00217253FC|nr:(2Fe-2S) ferredoxin domain-containing protein [Turicibacter sp. TA25]MCI8702551.1 (2Fe-2S) ferredoxin domain-containing protein [Turicibacter sp.]MCU7204625.1 (2Fe-2S) ferredoxin domain-containing protein [Turicibacter sp. TA25]
MKTLEELEQIRKRTLADLHLRRLDQAPVKVVVGMGTCGIASGAREVLKAFVHEVNQQGLMNVMITQSGEFEVCGNEPVVEIFDHLGKTTYLQMNEEKAKHVVLEHLMNGKVVSEFTEDSTSI